MVSVVILAIKGAEDSSFSLNRLGKAKIYQKGN